MSNHKMIVDKNVHYYCEIKKLICQTLFVLFFVEFILSSIFNKPPLILQQVMTSTLKRLTINEIIENTTPTNNQFEMKKYIYNLSNSRSDVYKMSGDIRIDSKSDTIFVESLDRSSWTVRPYARKLNNSETPFRAWKVQPSTNLKQFPNCDKNSSIPAILFDGAFAINYFHAFTDVLFPLYVTSMEFNRTVLFLISRSRPMWLTKFSSIFEKLTKYDIVNIDEETQVLCFSNMIVGLKADKELDIDPQVAPHHSIRDFRKFLRSTYSLKRETIDDCYKRRPRVLIVSRKYGRRLRNGKELANMVRGMGGDVTLEETGSNISYTAQYVNSFDVMIGVHGAGLTNMVFLPDDAVFVQIVPFAIEKYAQEFFGVPSGGMKLRYLEYKITLNESSLLGKYPPNSEIYTNPDAILKKGVPTFYKIYMGDQDVILDLDRFNVTLMNAMKLVLP